MGRMVALLARILGAGHRRHVAVPADGSWQPADVAKLEG
jgi:hypothetical protein